MKKMIVTSAFVFYACCLFAQNERLEAEIRNLEQLEVEAILKKDTVALLRLWDKAYVVNAPDNKINFAGKTTVDRPVLKRARTSFTRDIEEVIVRGNTVFCMGSETVVPAGDQAATQQIIKRRYTNIWMKQDGAWKLMARHANIICQ